MRNYNPDEVTFAFAAIKATELVQGEFLTIVFDNDQFSYVPDRDGFGGTRSRNKNVSGKVTLSLMQSSPMNMALSAILNADLTLPNGAGVGALTVRDRSGFSLHFAEQAYIIKWPDASYDMTAKDRKWVFQCARIENLIGGN